MVVRSTGECGGNKLREGLRIERNSSKASVDRADRGEDRKLGELLSSLLSDDVVDESLLISSTREAGRTRKLLNDAVASRTGRGATRTGLHSLDALKFMVNER